MLRVTPIGSCRIAGPLQRAQDRLGITTHKGRVYGYCHSSGEAVQMARFLQGQFVPDTDTWPLISRGTSLGALSRQDHSPSDLYVIELSSSKRLMIGGTFVQLNYVTSAYPHFFADPGRARAFWSLAESGNQVAIDRFLGKQPVSDTDRKLLRTLRLSLTTPEELQADIATLQDMLPRVLIVTHANARKPDGMPITTRATFIDMVKVASRKVGVRVYDPTQRMLEMGQDHALTDNSAGLAHYTDRFADAICDDWVALAIGPAIDDLAIAGATDTDVLAPHITALIGQMPFVPLLERLESLGESGVHVTDLVAAVQTAQGTLDQHHDPAHAAYLLGQHDLLLQRLQDANPLPDTDHLLKYAKAAPSLVAHQILLLGLAADPASAVIADRLADLLLEAGPDTHDVPLDLRPALLQHITPLQRIRICMAYGWGLQLAAQNLSPEDTTEVIAHIARTEGRKQALVFLQRLQFHAPLPAELSALLGKWCSCQDSDRLQKVQLCAAVAQVDPQNATARTMLRDIRRSIRNDMRNVMHSGETALLDQLAALNAHLPDPLPEVDLFRARASYNAGEYADVIRLGCAAAKALPDNLSVWVLLMRAAHKTGQTALSASFARRVIDLSTPDTSRFAAEAANRIGADQQGAANTPHLVPHD